MAKRRLGGSGKAFLRASLGDGRMGWLRFVAPVRIVAAYSLNEVCLNWNAPLAWVAAWLDEQAPAARRK